MSPLDDTTRLQHMLDAAQKAVALTHGKDPADVEVDEVLSFALVRLLEIVGEAASAVSEGLRGKYPKIPWRQMSSMRNRLIHGYFDVDSDLVWKTVTRELPPLIVQLQVALEKERR